VTRQCRSENTDLLTKYCIGYVVEYTVYSALCAYVIASTEEYLDKLVDKQLKLHLRCKQIPLIQINPAMSLSYLCGMF